ncbi:tetratricopeptide repeat protein [Rhodovibrionaceae bacterium A322]
MLEDRYGNLITTGSQQARDAYVEAVDLFLAANIGAVEALERAVQEDEGFALAYAAMARSHQLSARIPEAKAAMAQALALTEGVSDREKSHLAVMDLLIQGQGAAAYAAALTHLKTHPRDVLMAQPLTSVFGLIGFSGLPGREAEQLAFLQRLSPHYSADDWWFNCVLAFAQAEVGQLDPAWGTIQKSLSGNPRNANAAHFRAHIHYEKGETDAGLDYLADWRKDYEREGVLHCHISWHVALWLLAKGETDAAWAMIDDAVRPGAAWGPPLNVLTDTAAFLYRAELAGQKVSAERWQEVSNFAQRFFPNPALAFADTHAALAHAMAGDGEALQKIIETPTGPAGDVVVDLAQAFKAFAGQDWQGTIEHLLPALSCHERIGGSRAQRDLLEFTFMSALARSGRSEEAKLFLTARRPVHAGLEMRAAE